MTKKPRDMEDSYLMNVFKYYTAKNEIPQMSILLELRKRELLPIVSDMLQPQEGYRSPESYKEATV